MKTRTRYINKLEELGALVNQLSEKTVLDVRALGRALAGDADAAESVLSGSKAARRLREAIEDGCLDIMLMQQPLVADDLREVTGAFRLVSDLAHIDEMTRDAAYLSQQLTPKAISRLQSEFAEATDKVSNMVSLATKAFSQADAALAQRVFAMDDEVDELYDRCEQVVHIWKINSEGVVPDLAAISNGTAAVLMVCILAFNILARVIGKYLERRLTSE